MKRFLYVGFVLLFCVGCSSSKKENQVEKEGKIKVLSTTAMIGDIVSQIGGDRINHSVLILGEIDPHSYELVKGDDEKIGTASLVFFNGLNLEHGASLRHKLTLHEGSLALGDVIISKDPTRVLWEKGQVDPHIWMDVSLWALIVDPIEEALSAKDPEGKEYYKQRALKVKEEMLFFHEKFERQMHEIPENLRYLVTSHDAFGYFTRAYLATKEEQMNGTWHVRFAAPEGLAPDGQLGVADLQKIVNYLQEHHVEVVFPESNVSRDSLRKIVFACKEKNLNIRFAKDPLYGDSMGPAGSLSGTYLGMIEYDGTILRKEWK